MTAYSEFRIRIEPGPRKGQYRVEATGLGGDRTGAFKVPYSSAELENFVLKVGRTRRGVRKIASPEWDMAKTFGGRLFSSLIQGPVGELYRTSYSMAQATGDGLRITLSLTDSPELAEIPWEYLFDAPNFLAISTSTPVVRYLDVAKPRRPLQIELPIRILGVVSAPSDAEELKTDDERSRLESALKPLVDANAVSIDWLEEATLVALTKKMRPDTYHILHFIGHGGFDDSSGEGALLFEDETGRGRSVSGEQLATVLNNKVALRLVFLNSCEGARTSVKDPFSGVAASLIQREIPAVIAMQFEITDRAAIIFASEFYTMLAEGQPVDTSVTQARLTVFADQNDVEWGTPVLFMRVADGQLFNVEHAPALPRVAPEDLPPKAETRNGPAVPIAMAAAGALGAAPAGAAAVEAGTAVEPAPPGETGESGTSIESEPPGGPIVGSATAIGSAPAAEPPIEGDATAESPPAVETEAGTHAPAAWSAPSEPAAEGEATVGAMPAGRAVAAEAAVETGRSAEPETVVAPALAGLHATVEPPVVEPPPPGEPPPPVAPPPAEPAAGWPPTEPVAPTPRTPEPEPTVKPTQPAEPIIKPEPKPKPKPGLLSRKPVRIAAIGAIVVVAALFVLRLVTSPTGTGSLAVSTVGAAQTGLVTVSGAEYSPGEFLDIYLDDAVVKTVTVGADGTFSTQVDVRPKVGGVMSVLGGTSGRQARKEFSLPIAAASVPPGSQPAESQPAGPTASEPANPPASQPAPSTGGVVTVSTSPGILFYSDRSPGSTVKADNELYLLDPVSRAVTRLTDNDAADSFPTWSPDHKQIAYTRDGDIVVQSFADGKLTGPVEMVTSGTSNDFFPAWSVNDWIAFVRIRADNGVSEIRRIRHGETKSELIVSGKSVRAPAWSPDGTTLAYMSDPAGTGQFDVYTIKPGGDPTVLVKTDVSELNPNWSPDGKTIVFVRDKGQSKSYDNEIIKVDVASKVVSPPLTDNDVQDGNPVWSPDGKQICFYRALEASATTGYHLWIMNADGSGQTDLMPDRAGRNLDPIWR